MRRLRVLAWLCAACVASACAAVGSAPPSNPRVQPDATAYATPTAPAATTAAYVFYRDSDRIYVYSFERGAIGSLEATIRLERPSGVCGDEAGHVWIPDNGDKTMSEFARGGTEKIGALPLPADGRAGACAVDARDGDVAVAIDGLNGNDRHDALVYVYRRGSKHPTAYDTASGFRSIHFLTYDDADTLFADGYGCTGSKFCDERTGVFVLASDADSFEPVEFPKTRLTNATGLAWHHRELVVVDDLGAGRTSSAFAFVMARNVGVLADHFPLAAAVDPQGAAVSGDDAVIVDFRAKDARTYLLPDGHLQHVSSLQYGPHGIAFGP